MRGGVTVHELLHEFSHDDRESMYIVVKENIELSKASGQPFV
jgi:hypothetical protein